MSLADYNIGGFYSEDRRQIALDITYVEADNSLNAIATLLHEVYHCYEWECVRTYEKNLKNSNANTDLLICREFAEWQSNFDDYYSIERATELGNIGLY